MFAGRTLTPPQLFVSGLEDVARIGTMAIVDIRVGVNDHAALIDDIGG
jgi:hypothetical protein